MTDSELDRIRSEYRERDAASTSPYRWDNPGYVTYMQGLERALLRALATAGVLLGGASVLDVGCGSGYFAHRLHEYGAGECHGIDLLESRIADARARYPALAWHVGTATDLPFPDDSIDLVTQFTCLSSIVDHDVRAAAAREMRRVATRWVISFDMRHSSAPASATPTVGLRPEELSRLFGEPLLLRRACLRFDVSQRLGRRELVAGVLSLVPPLRSHYIGVWRAQSER